jgi:hypothetical protein
MVEDLYSLLKEPLSPSKKDRDLVTVDRSLARTPIGAGGHGLPA